MNTEDSVIICLPTSGHPTPGVPGSFREPCARCGQECWVSPATRRALPDAPVVCLPCWPRDIKEKSQGEPVDLAILPESRREVLRVLAHERRN